MGQMSVDELVKLLDSYSQKVGASIKPQFEGEKTNFVVGNGEVLSGGIGKSVEELSDYLVEESEKDTEIFTADASTNCASCANIPNMDYVVSDKDYD